MSEKKTDRLKEKFSLESLKQGKLLYLILVTVTLFVGYMALATEEVSLGNFLLAVAVESELKFTKSKAAILHTTHYFGRFVGRFLYGFITTCLNLTVIIPYLF